MPQTLTQPPNPRFYLDFEANPQRYPSTPYDPVALRHAFEAAVEKRMMSDVPFGGWGCTPEARSRGGRIAGRCAFAGLCSCLYRTACAMSGVPLW